MTGGTEDTDIFKRDMGNLADKLGAIGRTTGRNEMKIEVATWAAKHAAIIGQPAIDELLEMLKT